jgi:hypothetical protein
MNRVRQVLADHIGLGASLVKGRHYCGRDELAENYIQVIARIKAPYSHIGLGASLVKGRHYCGRDELAENYIQVIARIKAPYSRDFHS